MPVPASAPEACNPTLSGCCDMVAGLLVWYGRMWPWCARGLVPAKTSACWMSLSKESYVCRSHDTAYASYRQCGSGGRPLRLASRRGRYGTV